ncbi:hypothetical protein B566_EDAN012214 [Ephemera danica]|nr:hypothetical protein B566_EDAN012214 [Ephemera danica]
MAGDDDDGGGGGGSRLQQQVTASGPIKSPKDFDFDRPTSWPDFIYGFKQYLWLLGLRSEANDEEKIVRLQYHLGVRSEPIMKTLTFNQDHPKTFDNVVNGFSAYFEPKKNTLFHRCIFNRREQLENETAEHFIREILSLSELCDFKDMKDEFTRDRLVVGIKDKQLSEELQEDHTVSLATVMEKIRSREQIKQQQAIMASEKRAFSSSNDFNVDVVGRRAPAGGKGIGTKDVAGQMKISCSFCGRVHARRACPAYGKDCSYCGKKNHFASVCRGKPRKKAVEEVVVEENEVFDIDDLYIGAVSDDGKTPWRTQIVVGKTSIDMKIDSGADVTCLGKMKVEYTIKLQENAVPVAAATHRRIPHPLRDLVKKKLDQLISLDVTEPTPWCGYMVVVPKPGANDIRVTIDNSGLAKSVIRDRVVLPSVEETLAKMGGAKIFSKLDARDGFWQIPLSEECRNLTTFCTPWGRYKFNRLFMGCTSAREKMYIPDLLSRSPTSQKNEESWCLEEDTEAYVRQITSEIRIADATLSRVHQAQKDDTEIQTLKHMIKNGFPEQKEKAAVEVRNFWQFRHELNIANDLVMFRSRIVIPISLRKEMLTKLHVAHMGIVKTQLHARATIFWPGMTRDIEMLVKTCDACTCKNPIRKEPLIIRKPVNLPWQKICMDIAEYEGKHYLVFVDTYSRYIEVKLLNNLTSNEIVRACKEVYARHGIPQYSFSDCGTQFVAMEFHRFTNEYGIIHETSSPRYPQSNGQAEAAVKVIKNILKKCEDLQLGLLFYRSTEIPDIGASPAELLFGRKLRTTIPMVVEKLKPKVINAQMFTEKDRAAKERTKRYFDEAHGVREREPLQEGQCVWLTDLGRRGHVLRSVSGAPRSYLVKTDLGVIRRNTTHIRKLHESPSRGHQLTNLDKCKTPTNQNIMSTSPSSTVRPNTNQQDSPPTPISPLWVAQQQAGRASVTTRTGRTIKRPRRLDL